MTATDVDDAAQVVFEELPAFNERKVGLAQLNAPKTLNSLTIQMVELLLQQLQLWEKDSDITCVIITGSGDKAFCAGGDVQALRNSSIANPGGPCPEAEEFFSREYRLNYTLHTYNKPVVVWGDGIVMGGGLGILAGASHRVVTETSRFAMPEVSIGLYPDVGGSFFLNQMPGFTGRFLALTGASFNGADALYTGVADVFILREHFAALLGEIKNTAVTNNSDMSQILAAFGEQSKASMPPGKVEPHRQAIDTLCADQSIRVIVNNLASLKTTDKWLVKAQQGIAYGSPVSMLLIDEQLSRSQGQPLAEVFRGELVLSTNIVRFSEFAEGVRALLVDKDRQPKWRYPDIESVPDSLIQSFFVAPWALNPLADL